MAQAQPELTEGYYMHVFDQCYEELAERNELEVDDPEWLSYDDVHDGALDATREWLLQDGYSEVQIAQVETNL